MEAHPSLNKETADETVNIREQLEKYFVYWKWFIVSIVLCLLVAGIYLRYAVPLYKATSVIMVKDERKGGMQSEISAFEDLGLMKGVKSNVDNEVEVIKSNTNIENAVKRLNFNITFFEQGRVKLVELYQNSILECTVVDMDKSYYDTAVAYKIKSVSKGKFEVFDSKEKSIGQYNFGDLVPLKHCKVIIRKKAFAEALDLPNFDITMRFSKLVDVTRKYKNKLNIAPLGKNTSVVELSIIDPVPEKAKDILNSIIQIYNEDAIADKNFISKNTEKFIDERLKLISQELGDVVKDAEGFKQSNQVTDIVSEAGLYLQNSALYEKELIEVETQLRIVESMIGFMKKIEISDLVPINIIPSDQATGSFISEHNNLVVERNRIVKTGTEKNPMVINLDKKIEELNENIKSSLFTVKSTLLIRRSDLQKSNNMISGKISQIPRQERQFRIIDRQQKIKESLYLYLLQKREEIAISLAVTPANAKVIDAAISDEQPIAPQRGIIYLGALFIGFLLPFIVLYIMQLLDTKIKTRQDVETKVSIPFLGDIPKSESNDEIINTNSRSSSAEAIRIVRTNLEFMLGNVDENRAKTVFVTSTLPKEGKTFVAVNLATTIALSDKRYCS